MTPEELKDKFYAECLYEFAEVKFPKHPDEIWQWIETNCLPATLPKPQTTDPFPNEVALKQRFYADCAVMSDHPPIYEEKWKVIPYQVFEWIRLFVVYPLTGFDPDKTWDEVQEQEVQS